jgi:hypothetical protein
MRKYWHAFGHSWTLCRDGCYYRDNLKGQIMASKTNLNVCINSTNVYLLKPSAFILKL